MFLDKKINVRIREEYLSRIKKIRSLSVDYPKESDFFRAGIFALIVKKERELGIFKEPVVKSTDTKLTHKDEVVI